MRNLYLLLILTLSLISCGKSSKKEERLRPTYESCLAQGKLYYNGGCYAGSGAPHAQGRFSLLNDASLLKILDGRKISVCIVNEALAMSRVLEVQTNVEKAFHVWLKEVEDLLPNKNINLEFKTVNKYSIPEEDEKLLEICDQTQDIKISLRKVIDSDGEDREYARPEMMAMFLNESSPYTTILHEMGHLFGLADIYVEDVWTCKAGFSNSVMCDSGWGKPVLDDIEGVRRAYCLATDGLSPKCFNHVKTGIMSFLPADVKRNGRVSAGSYLACFSGDRYFSLGYSIVSHVKKVGEQYEYTGGEFFSTDERSIREIKSPGKYEVIIETRMVDAERGALSESSSLVRFSIDKDFVTISIPSEGITFSQAAYQCSFDEKFLTFLETNGLESSAIRARQYYNKLVDKVLAQTTSETVANDLQFNMLIELQDDLSNAEIKIFTDNEERTLLKSVALNTLKYEQVGQVLKFDFDSTLELAEGIYYIHLDNINSPIAELKLTVKAASIPNLVTSPTPTPISI